MKKYLEVLSTLVGTLSKLHVTFNPAITQKWLPLLKIKIFFKK